MIFANKIDLMAVDANTYLVNLGRKIEELRLSKGMSQYRLAKMLFIEQSSLARIEKGKTNPTVKTLLKICDALEIPIENLFT